MLFIHRVKIKYIYSIRNVLFLASQGEINGIFVKKMNFLFIMFNFKRDILFAPNDVIHARTLRHILMTLHNVQSLRKLKSQEQE